MTLRLTAKEAARLQNAQNNATPQKPAKRDRTERRGTPPRPAEAVLCAHRGTVARVEVFVRMLPPTVNHMKRPNGRGGAILTDEVNIFRKLVWAELYHGGMPALPSDGDLALTIRLTFGNRLRQDIDNRAKAALDALALALGFDDSRIARLTVERAGYDKGRPACELVLEAINA